MNARLAKASVAFGRLYKKVWNRRGITTETKSKDYRAVILTTLLYGCEAWTVYQGHARKLHNFHTTRLRKLLSIKWHEKIPDTKVLTRAGLPSVYAMLMKSQLRGVGPIAQTKMAATLPYPHYPRLFQARVDLTSHLRTHLTNQTTPP